MVLGLASRPSSTPHHALYFLGLTAGALVTGATLSAAGFAVSLVLGQRVMMIAASIIAVAYAMTDFGLWRVPSIGRHWQVPRRWLGRLPLSVTYALFGVLLGFGFLTVVPFAAFTALLVFEFAEASVLSGILIGSMYGIGRGVGLVIGKHSIQTLKPMSPTAAIPTLLSHIIIWRHALALMVLLVGILELLVFL